MIVTFFVPFFSLKKKKIDFTKLFLPTRTLYVLVFLRCNLVKIHFYKLNF